VEKSEGKRPLGRPRVRLDVIHKEISLKFILRIPMCFYQNKMGIVDTSIHINLLSNVGYMFRTLWGHHQAVEYLLYICLYICAELHSWGPNYVYIETSCLF
jgi:hypothetical protein